MSEMLKSRQGMGSASDAPVPVMVAGTAMVAIKCISVLLLLGELGVDGAQEFVNTSAQAWDSTFIFLAGLVLLCLQISCGFAVMRGRNWGRWGYVACQCVVVAYLLLATIGSLLPEVFTVEGETSGQILRILILQKIPDAVILVLLFVPAVSRRFFAAGG
ncbi:YbjO family protein [Serratia entomophila]|uniref:YbjO family protein n=1 Tax=Serratia entomophila TaxID=42906 RepID=UPI002178E939|nr:YbjO family protein [Serratia entomophila]CAI1064700.1 Inner membrane protein ybjO [Serratia entomophila]CAI1626035.1 Inner membrane protein ybjO [Serratia entomophila]CAI1708350.1 Inner membrane protein ybjO [Serratia entomophila]